MHGGKTFVAQNSGGIKGRGCAKLTNCAHTHTLTNIYFYFLNLYAVTEKSNYEKVRDMTHNQREESDNNNSSNECSVGLVGETHLCGSPYLCASVCECVGV